jgi:tetratricopeptide (TPR) repeat protein
VSVLTALAHGAPPNLLSRDFRLQAEVLRLQAEVLRLQAEDRRRPATFCLKAEATSAFAFCLKAEATSAFATSSVAIQSAGARPSIPERLKRVRDDLFTRTDRVEASIDELKSILAVDPSSAEAHLLLGLAYRSLGTPEFLGEAVAELRQALALEPALVPARLYLGYLYRDLGRPQRAKEELATALTQAPGHPQLLALLADTERQLGDPTRALALADQALKADPSFAQARYYRGLALLDLKRREEGLAELEQVVQGGPPVPEAYLALGAAYLEAGRPDPALQVLTLGHKLAPDRPDLTVQLARACRLKGLLTRADQLITKALAGGTSPAYSFSQFQQVESDLYLERGRVRLQQGRLEAAAAAFQKVLDMDSTHATAGAHLAEVKRRMQQQSKKKPGAGGGE